MIVEKNCFFANGYLLPRTRSPIAMKHIMKTESQTHRLFRFFRARLVHAGRCISHTFAFRRKSSRPLLCSIVAFPLSFSTFARLLRFFFDLSGNESLRFSASQCYGLRENRKDRESSEEAPDSVWQLEKRRERWYYTALRPCSTCTFRRTTVTILYHPYSFQERECCKRQGTRAGLTTSYIHATQPPLPGTISLIRLISYLLEKTHMCASLPIRIYFLEPSSNPHMDIRYFSFHFLIAQCLHTVNT